jgi:hypothetical protein
MILTYLSLWGRIDMAQPLALLFHPVVARWFDEKMR